MIQEQLYDIFIRFEERSADFYLDLSIKFADNTDLSWFWVEMAMEEKQHAGLLQYCKEMRMFPKHLTTSEQIQRLGALFRELSAKIAAPDLTLDAALEAALRLEGSEINEIYNGLTANLNGPWYIIRKKIELSMGNHYERLRGAAVRFGACEAIRNQLQELSAAAA
jgi:rubrerythrin